MFKYKGHLISILFCLFLIGCTGTSSPTIDTEKEEESTLSSMDQLRQEKLIFEEKVKEFQERPNEKFMMDLRENMNLSFKIIHAVESNSYAYLESVSASGIAINMKENQLVYFYDDNEIKMDFLKGIHLDNLEYWGSGYMKNETNFQIIFAHFQGDTHGTIYFDFIQKDDHWLFNGFMTNA